MLTATSIAGTGTIALSAPTEAGYTYTMLETATTRKLVRTPNVAFSYDGTIGATPSGWFNAWGGESFGDRLRVGPDSGKPVVYEVYHDSDSAKAHPYYGLAARSAFSFALYADVSQVGSDGRKVLASFGNSSAGLVLYRQGDYVKVGRVTSAGFTGGWAAAVAIPASGYHLYTVTYDPNGTIALYLDDGASSSSSSSLGAMSLNAGMQIGGMYQGVPTGNVFNDGAFAQGIGMAFASIRGYDAVLGPDNVAKLAESFPAVSSLNPDWNITVNKANNATFTACDATMTQGHTLQVHRGAFVIPEGNTLSVPILRTLNIDSGSPTITATIDGTLDITGTSGKNVWSERGGANPGGIVFGEWTGSGAYTISSTGKILAPNAYLQTVKSAGNQDITVNGGVISVKGIWADTGRNNSSITLQNGGTLEVADIPSDGGAITKNFGYGIFRVKADATETRAINFQGTASQPTTLDPFGNTLTLQSAALTGSGDITVADSSDGHAGKVVFVGGSSYTGRLIMTDANAANIDISGYTGTVLCQGTAATTIAMFDGFEGTVYFTDNVDATVIDLSGAKVVIADNVIYTAAIGKEGAMTLGAGAVAKLFGTTATQIKYDGYVPNVTGAGSVQYWDDAEPSVQIADGYTIDGNSETTGLISGVNLVPYYYVWEVAAGGSAGIANGSAGWSRIESNVRPVDGKNIAFHIQGTAGQVTTITVDDNATFGSIVVYGTGIAKFVSSENKTISVATMVADTPVQIGQGAVAVSGIIRDNSSVAFTGTQTIGVEITGTGAVYVGDGTTTSDITFAHCNSFAGGMIVKSNAKTTTTSGARADGVGTGFGAYGGTVTVYTGGKVDVANTSGVCYDYVIEDGGESETPALTNSGSVIGIDARQARSLTVNADAIIECPTSKGWGLVNNGHDTTSLTIKKGTTLTKKGAGTFILCNTAISNTGEAEALPKLVIAEGNVSTENTGSGGAGAWDIDIEDGGKLLLEKGIGARNITVENGGKITMSGSDGWLNGLTALTIDAGGEVDCSGTTKTESVINTGTLTVNGTLNMGGRTWSVTTLEGAGTVKWTGKQPDGSANNSVWMQNTWSGTNEVVNVGAYDIQLYPQYWGRNGSYIKLTAVMGYVANNTTVQAETILDNGAYTYALKPANGNSNNNPVIFRKIVGDGTLTDSNNNAVLNYILRDADDFSGSITLSSASRAYVFSRDKTSGYPDRTTYSGCIYVDTDGRATIGAGKTWTANSGKNIYVNGQVTLCGGAGAATMASSTTFGDGATLVFQDGASLAFTAATTPVTLPVSGTVNINANAMNSLTSEGATIITSTTAFTADDVAKLKSVGHHVFMLDAEDAKKINVYPAVAKVGDTYYTDLATAEAAVNAANPSITIYSGSPADASIYHNLGDSTYRLKNQNVYFVYGAWDATAVFCLADGTVTTVYDGDTVVIDNNFTANSIAVSPTAAPANATNVRIDKNITMSQSADGTILSDTTFTIADGAMLTISGASRAVTLGAVTFDKAVATGAVTLDGGTNAITLGGNLSGSAPATITGTVIATGKTIANTLKNTPGGTIVYDGTLPSAAPTFDSTWTGTVWLKNYTDLTGATKQSDQNLGSTNFEPNSYGNDKSTVKLTGVKGYLTATDDGSYTIQPALELEDDGETPGLLLYNGWGYNTTVRCYTIIRELKGNGTLKADTTADGAGGSIKGLNVLLQVRNWGNFTGTLNMTNKNVVFGNSLPEQLVVEGGGKIFVRSGASVTIPSGKTWTCGTFYVDGTLSAVNKSAWSGAMQIGDTGVLEITRSDDSYSDDGGTDYAADVSGSGTLRYSGTGFTVISSKIPASLTVEANKDSGIIVPAAGVAIGSLSGSKNIRSDWGPSAAGGRHLTIKQSRDTTWSGVFLEAEDRLSSVIVDPGTSSTGTLTLAGDQVTANSGYANNRQQSNDLVVNGAVKLTGKWVGPITVSGTFGGNGTANSAVTFNAGSTYRYDTGYLNASGGVVVNAGDVVWVETSVEPTDDMVLMDWTATSGSNTAPAGIFRFKNTDYRGVWTPTIVDNQLVVKARTSTTIDVAAETTSERSDNFADCTITKTGDGKAILTGSIQGASLDIDGGTVELKSAATIEDLTGDVGTKLIISANLDMRDVATLDDFNGTIEIAKGVKVIVSEAVKDALVALQPEGYYNVIANKDGSYTISVAPSGTVIQFVTNDLGANINVPEDDEGVEYIPDNGNVAVKIGTAPIKLDNFTGMNRVTPFTLSLDVTIPEEIDYTGYADGFGPVLFSFNAGPNEIFIMRKSNGVMAARFYPYNSGDSTTDYAAVSGQKVATKILELGKTYHIDLRYWGALASKDGDTYKVNRGFGSAKTGTTVFVDGVEDWHHNGLRWGSMTLHKTNGTADGYSVNGSDFIGDAATQEPLADEEFHKSYIFPTNIVIGAATKATGTGERVFTDLVVRGVGFMNLAGFYEKAGVDTVNAALPSMISSDSLATYWYDYGVTASSVSGGYALGEQTTYGVNGGEVSSTYSRGVIMNHMQLGEGKFTITMGVSIPAGATGGTICEIPMNSDSITVTYDGSTDKFALNGTAQDEAAGDGAHVLVLTYDTAYGAYLWVDSYDEDGEKTNATISDAVCRGKTLSNAIYFGSGAAATSSNGFFAGLGVAHQNVQFGYAVCDEADVETALKSFDFGPELASMPLSMRLKCLANMSPDGATIPVPTITIGSKVLTGYAALSAAMAMGVYTNYVTSLSMSSYDSSTGNMACEVDPNFAGKMSVSLAGSANNLVWTRLAVSTIAENATSVSLPLGSHAFGNGGDYRWFKILEEPYTNNAPVEVGRIHEKLADRPTTDFIFKKGETGWNQDVYRIPAMAATPDGQTVMGIFDARYCYQDLGVPLDANGNGAGPYDSPNHYTGIDIGGVFSLDAGENWSYPQVMIDVPNASNPQTGAKTTTLTKDMELGDPSIVYDSTNSKFIMMGITGGGLTTVHNGAEAVDVVTYECTLESVKNGAPKWTNRTSVKQLIEAQLNSEYSIQTNDYKTTWYGNGYMGILQGPGHAFVTRAACGSIPAGTVVWPMQYVIRNSGIKGGNFAAWKDSSGNWHATKLVPSSGGTNNYVTQEGCITQLDNGYLLYMCKNVTDGTKRPFYVSSDGVNWTYHTEITGLASGSMCQGSMLRLGYGSDGNSRYAAVFATGALRSDIKVYIGTDTGSGGITWDAEPYETVWAGATGTADDDGNGAHGNLVYGYNSLVMLNPTTLGVLFEAHGHIYFTKVDVSSVLQ